MVLARWSNIAIVALTASVVVARQASAEQLNPYSSVHLPLECFETVDVSLDRSVTPRFGNCRFDGTEVLFQGPHKAHHGVNPFSLCNHKSTGRAVRLPDHQALSAEALVRSARGVDAQEARFVDELFIDRIPITISEFVAAFGMLQHVN